MTPRQRVLAALRRTTLPDRCPFEISWGEFTPGLMILKERTRRIIAAAKRVKPDLLVFMHCDGQVAEFIRNTLRSARTSSTRCNRNATTSRRSAGSMGTGFRSGVASARNP